MLTPAALRKLEVDGTSGDSVSVGFAAKRFTVAGWRAQVNESK